MFVYIYDTTDGSIATIYTGPTEYISQQVGVGQAYVESAINYAQNEYYYDGVDFVAYPADKHFCSFVGGVWVATIPTPAIINLLATPDNVLNTINLTWEVSETNYPTYNFEIEIWHSTIFDIGTATLIDTTVNWEYVFNNVQYADHFFWIRATYPGGAGAYESSSVTLGAPVQSTPTMIEFSALTGTSPVLLPGMSRIYGIDEGRYEPGLDIGGPVLSLGTSWKHARFQWQSIAASTAEFAYQAFGGALSIINTSFLGQSTLAPGVGITSYPYQKFLTQNGLGVYINGHWSSSTNLKSYVGTQANLGRDGFYYSCKFGIPAYDGTGKAFIGLSSSTSTPTNVNPLTLTNVLGIAKGVSDNTFHFVASGSVATSYSLGIVINTTHAYQLIINGSNGLGEGVYLTLIDLTDQTGVTYLVVGTQGTDFPGASTALYHRAWIATSGSATDQELAISNINLEFNK